MKSLLLLPLVLMFFASPQDPVGTEENSPVVVNSYKWFRDRQPAEQASSIVLNPAPAMIAANKNFEKQKRVNDPAGVRDPNADSLDGRGAALEKIVQDSREAPPVDGFTYLVKVQNAGTKQIQNVFWEYQFREIANPTNVVHRQFVCSSKIKPEKDRDFQVFSLAGPSDVISAKSLVKGSGKQFEESVVINRVEYADGTHWQRKDWKYDLARFNAKSARNLPTCRGL
jgi:hypothetical protein